MALADFPSLFLGSGRAVVAATLAIIVLIITRTAFPSGKQILRLIVVALGVVVGFPFLTSLALVHTQAAHGAVIIGLLPAATAVAAVIRGKERPSWIFWLASLSGAAAIMIFSALTSEVQGSIGLGDWLFLGAVVLAAIGYAEGAMLSREIGSWQTISWALVVALPAMIPVTILSAQPITWDSIALPSWLGFAYISVISMYLGFFAWYRGLAIGPMASVSQIQLVQPILTIAWAAMFFGEDVPPIVWLGAVVVILLALTAVRARIKVITS